MMPTVTNAVPSTSAVPARLYHYSDDAHLDRFVPHVPPSDPGHPPAVWAIDAEHSPLYWFPRMCPRISVWARTPSEQSVLTEVFGTESHRICAAETHWLEGIRTGHLYRYTFDGVDFHRWEEADGQYVSDRVVQPIGVDRLNDLLGLHAAAEVELRITPRLGRLMDQITASGLPFSFVRIRDARR
jgi:hypothetical protein